MGIDDDNGAGTLAGPYDVVSERAAMNLAMKTMKGTPSVASRNGVRTSDGARNYSLVLERDGAEIELAMVFAPGGETFDPSDAVSFSREVSPDHEEPMVAGDVLVMRFEMIR